MTANILNIGTVDNDGTGDSFRWAFRKINQGAAVVSMATDVPAAPTGYEFYIVPSAATGAWVGQDMALAWYEPDASAWEFYTPYEGVRVWVQDTQEMVVFKSGIWDNAAIGGGGGGDTTPAVFKGFRATTAATQAITASTITSVAFGTEVFDTEAAFASNVFTVPAALDGKYMSFMAGLRFSGNEDSMLYLRVDTGGGPVIVAQSGHDNAVAGNIASGPHLMNTGDVWDLAVFTATVATIDIAESSFFSGVVLESSDNAIIDPKVVTASRNVLLADLGDILEVDTGAGAVTLTIEQGSVIAYTTGFIVGFTAFNVSSAITIAADALVTLNGVLGGSTTMTATAYKGASLYRRGTDDWVLQGDVGVVT